MHFSEWVEENEDRVWAEFCAMSNADLRKLKIGRDEYGKYLYGEWEKAVAAEILKPDK